MMTALLRVVLVAAVVQLSSQEDCLGEYCFADEGSSPSASDQVKQQISTASVQLDTHISANTPKESESKLRLSAPFSSNKACPTLVEPSDVGFLVINLDRSPQRLERMREMFDELGIPQFERVPGVEVRSGGGPYDVPRLTEGLKPADYGTCLAHLKAWKAAYNSKHRWNVIIEDDAVLLPNVSYTGPYPKVPKAADLVLFRASSMFERDPVCADTSVMRAHWGYGMVAYLVNRAGAKRLIDNAHQGFKSPIDGHIWYHNEVYVMQDDWVTHPPCANPCPTSIRTWLNGELGGAAAPD